MSVASVAVYSEADRHSLHVRHANEAVAIGPPAPSQSYLAIDRILEAARKTGAEAIHPGYGFLSENAEFAEACQDAGMAFLGPTPSQIRTLGAANKERPSPAGHARRIAVQIFGDGQGKVLALGERDCSAQLRNRKIIEEAPAPGLSAELRARLFAASIARGEAVRYRSAGAVEFLCDDARGEFCFLEVIPRLQAEHGVTEEVTGIDLVEWMVRLAAHELPPLDHLKPNMRGHSIQVRINAEDPAKNFQPSAGTLTHVKLPTRARCETWVESGAGISSFYDPMMANIIVRGDRRETAVRALHKALTEARFDGVETNLHYLWQIASGDLFERGGYTTAYLADFNYELDALEVIEPGTQTTVQDYPGRTGFWHVGVPPSGPMDALTFRLANRLVGNPETAAALECAMTGPVLKFHEPAIIAVCGADMGARLNGKPLSYWRPVQVRAGSELRMGHVRGDGARAYIAVRGGFDVPEYLGSRATFTPGSFGGHAGRSLRAGDLLRWDADEGASPVPGPLGSELIPEYTSEWEIGVLYGPHGAPDFFTGADIEMIFSTSWRVHYNSDRTGVRLIGPKPKWARKDGGEAGLHPSNLHQNAYAIGAMNFTGDLPALLGPDGPSLGGFVCPATIVHAELWKMGQLKPGDTSASSVSPKRKRARWNAVRISPSRSSKIFSRCCPIRPPGPSPPSAASAVT
jgi:urea carboxylase